MIYLALAFPELRLELVDLSRNRIGSSGAIALAEAVHAARVVLAANAIGEAAGAALGAMDCECLDLGANALGDPGGRAFSLAVMNQELSESPATRVFRELRAPFRELSLRGNDLTDRFLPFSYELLLTNRFDLRENLFTPRAIAAYARRVGSAVAGAPFVLGSHTSAVASSPTQHSPSPQSVSEL